LYRRHLGEPLRVTVRAPVVIMGAELEYRSILVPLAPGYPSSEAMDIACRLSRERGSRIVAMTVIEVPLDLPLDAYLPETGGGGEPAPRRGASDRRLLRSECRRSHHPRA